MATLVGTGGNDFLNGTVHDDIFDLTQGGTDAVSGRAGDDVFRMGATLEALDSIGGGAGRDVVSLDGDYSAGLVFGADTLRDVEALKLAGNFTYNLTMNDANVARGERLVVDGRNVDGLTFDGSAETNGGFVVRDTWGNDYLVGGRRGDTFVLSHDLAQDRVFGGPGDDVVKFANMDISDSVDGGAGYDTLKLGTYLSEGDPLHIANVERVALATDAAFVLIDDTAVAAGKVLEFDATEVASFTFSGFAETDGHLKILGGSGNGEIDGGAAADVVRMQAGSDSYLIAGNGAADRIVCNSGKEVLRYLSSTDSTGAAGHDVVRHFDADQDQFEFYKDEVSLTGGVAAAPVLAPVNAASFDADLHAAGDGGLAANGAWVVHVTHGDLHGHEFLCVDTNGNAMYDAGTDYVIDITGYTGTLDASDFILSS